MPNSFPPCFYLAQSQMEESHPDAQRFSLFFFRTSAWSIFFRKQYLALLHFQSCFCISLSPHFESFFWSHFHPKHKFLLCPIFLDGVAPDSQFLENKNQPPLQPLLNITTSKNYVLRTLHILQSRWHCYCQLSTSDYEEMGDGQS